MRRPNAIAIPATIAIATCVACGQCPPRYTVDLLVPSPCGILGPPGIGVTGISEVGEMCGGGGTCAKSQSAGFAWYGSFPLYYLPMPQGFAGVPRDINSTRQMVGYMANTSGRTNHGFYHDNGITIDLGWPTGGNFSEAHAINDRGCVTGVWGNNWTGNPGLAAFLWDKGEFRTLDLPIGPNSYAYDVTSDGSICGWMGDAPYWITCHAFVWKDGATTDLGTVLPDADTAVARALNNIGSVCGFSIYQPTSQNPIRKAFIWREGKAQYLGTLSPFTSSYALDLNDSNAIVGYCDDFPVTGGTKAFVWEKGTMYALDDVVPAELGLVIWIAEAINNAGQIAAYGHYPDPNGSGNIYVAMRLNPVPPLPGDINCDWNVSVQDLLAVINSWGACPPPDEPFTKNCHADLNDDGVVGLDDLLTVVLNWGS